MIPHEMSLHKCKLPIDTRIYYLFLFVDMVKISYGTIYIIYEYVTYIAKETFSWGKIKWKCSLQGLIWRDQLLYLKMSLFTGFIV